MIPKYLDGNEVPEDDKIYRARPLQEVQIIASKINKPGDLQQMAIDDVNSFYYNDVVPRLIREHKNLKTKPDTNFPYITKADIIHEPMWKRNIRNRKISGYATPDLKIHTFSGPGYADTPSVGYNSLLTHENTHIWQYQLPKRDKEYKEKSKQLLNDAYIPGIGLKNIYGVFAPAFKHVEQEAVNREIRYRLWHDLKEQLGRVPTIDEVDEAINNEFDSYLLDKASGGYFDAHPILEEEGSIKDNFKKNSDKVRQALIHVAQNNTSNDTVNYAAKGGKLIPRYKQGQPLPYYDPKHPYTYRDKNGNIVEISTEDWEKYKNDPAFSAIRTAVEENQLKGPEYEINPNFVRDLRSTYEYNMGNGYQNYRNFSDNLPEGYSFTNEGVIIGPDGTAYVEKGFRQSPRFTYNTNSPLQFTINTGLPIERNLTFYPVNMEKKIKTLPISRVMDVAKAKQQAEDDNTFFISGLNTDRIVYFPEWATAWRSDKPVRLTKKLYEEAIDFARKDGADKWILEEFNKAGKWVKGEELVVIPITSSNEDNEFVKEIQKALRQKGDTKYFVINPDEGTTEESSLESAVNHVNDYKQRKRLLLREN